MYDRYRSRSRSREGPDYRRHDHQNADADVRDRDYYRSRKAAQSPARSLNYDDDDEEEGEERPRGHRQSRDGSNDRDYPRSYGASNHLDRDRDRDWDRDRDRDWDRDRNHGRGHRRNGYDRPSGGGSLILDGLPEDITERDIYDALDYVARDRHMSDDQVKHARLRYDNRDRLVACVDFFRRSDAEYFYDKHRPCITFPLAHSRGGDSEPITVDIDLDVDRDDSRDRRDNADWDCVNCGSTNYAHRTGCYRCRVERPEEDSYGMTIPGGPVLTGETDEDPQQLASQYIVVRDLESSVTEEVLSKGVMKLFLESKPEPAKATTNKLKSTAPTNSTAGLGAKPGTLRRVFLMRDRRTNESWRYGFAEFATIDDARAAVAKFRASAKFTIASKPVFIAFIHTGVFVPVQDALAMGDQLEKFSFTPVYNQAIRLRYWDDRAYSSALVVHVDPVPGPESPTKEGAGEGAKTTKTGNNPNRLPASFKKVKKEKEAAIAAAASAKRIVMAPQIQMWAKKSAELHGSRSAVEGMGEIAMEDHDGLGDPTISVSEGQELAFRQDFLLDKPCNPRSTDQYSSYADWDRLACLLCDWEVPSDDVLAQKGHDHSRREDILIDHEMQHHKLYRDTCTRLRAAGKLASLGKRPRIVVRRIPRRLSAAPPAFLSYADPGARQCHLCRRKFKHVQTLWRHEHESELHRRMLDDPASRQRALAELAVKSKGASSVVVMVPDQKTRIQWWEDLQELRREATRRQQPQYRDRAQERRAAFNQPSKPSAVAATAGEKRKERDQAGEEGGGGGGGGQHHQPQQPAAKKLAIAAASKGMGMLAKMGWTAGAGLGAEGTGRIEAIATDAYAPGVGLGAEGGKLGDAAEEAARKTRGYFSDFVEKTKDKARERFEKM